MFDRNLGQGNIPSVDDHNELLNLTRDKSILGRIAHYKIIELIDVFYFHFLICEFSTIDYDDWTHFLVPTMAINDSFLDQRLQFFLILKRRNYLILDQPLILEDFFIDFLMVIIHRVQEPQVIVVQIISEACGHIETFFGDPCTEFKNFLSFKLA